MRGNINNQRISQKVINALWREDELLREWERIFFPQQTLSTRFS